MLCLQVHQGWHCQPHGSSAPPPPPSVCQGSRPEAGRATLTHLHNEVAPAFETQEKYSALPPGPVVRGSPDDLWSNFLWGHSSLFEEGCFHHPCRMSEVQQVSPTCVFLSRQYFLCVFPFPFHSLSNSMEECPWVRIKKTKKHKSAVLLLT